MGGRNEVEAVMVPQWGQFIFDDPPSSDIDDATGSEDGHGQNLGHESYKGFVGSAGMYELVAVDLEVDAFVHHILAREGGRESEMLYPG